MLTDQPIVLRDSAPINSWFTQYGSRSINAVEARNTPLILYGQIAKMMGQPYTPNMNLTNWIQIRPCYEKLHFKAALKNDITWFVP